MDAPLTFWSRLLGRDRQSPLHVNYYERVHALAGPAHQGMIDQLWYWLQRRREMDGEYRLHILARSWVVAHTVAAWVLFFLVIDHVAASLWYGGS